MEAEQIMELVRAHQAEHLHLEFKRDAPSNNSDKEEFLKDVTAMANAEGGTIIFGIDEEKNQASELVGVPSEEQRKRRVTVGSLCERLAAWSEDIDVPLRSLPIEAKSVGAVDVIVVQVPEGHAKPHSYHHNKRPSFKLRLSTAKTRDLRKDELEKMFAEREPRSTTTAGPACVQRARVLTGVFAVLLVFTLGGGMWLDSGLVGTTSSEELGWWDDLWEERILRMPAGVAIGVGIGMVLLLMLITHQIESRNESRHHKPVLGDSVSWATSTLIILSIVGLGLFYGIQSRFGPGRWAILGLSVLVVVLFFADGLMKGQRLCVFPTRKTKKKNG